MRIVAVLWAFIVGGCMAWALGNASVAHAGDKAEPIDVKPPSFVLPPAPGRLPVTANGTIYTYGVQNVLADTETMDCGVVQQVLAAAWNKSTSDYYVVPLGTCSYGFTGSGDTYVVLWNRFKIGDGALIGAYAYKLTLLSARDKGKK